MLASAYTFLKENPAYVIIGATVGIAPIARKYLIQKKRFVSKLEYGTKYNWVSDVTKMDARPMEKIFYVKNCDDIIEVVNLAISNKKKISIAGQFHTMGGHTIIENGYLINMKYMNQIIDFDIKNKTVKVQPGMMWSDLLKFLNEHGYSPMTLQSYSSFSIGGSISVNAHGITNDRCLCESIVDIHYVDSNGNQRYCSNDVNSDMFYKIIGGYGLFGIIYEVTLKNSPNVGLKMEYNCLSIGNFYEKFLDATNDPSINIKLGRINITNFKEIFMYAFHEKNDGNIVSELGDKPHSMSKPSRLIYKWIMPIEEGQKIRYSLEKIFKKPLDWADECERNKLLYETAAPMASLYNPLIPMDRTHILQEYFIPNNSFVDWMLFLESTFIGTKFNKISLLNITVRYVQTDDKTFLSYANKPMFAFVFYFRIERNEDSNRELETIHNTLCEKALELDGTFYLPYRHHYSDEQLLRAYPKITDFFRSKHESDPKCIFTNMWHKRYANVNHNGEIDNINHNREIDNINHDIEIDNINHNIEIDNINHDIKIDNINVIESIPEHATQNPIFKPVANPSNTDKNSYQAIFNSPILEYSFKEFLKNIFYLMPAIEMFDLVKSIMQSNPNSSDIEVFMQVQKYMMNLSLSRKVIQKFRMMQILQDQRKDFVQQFKNIISEIGSRKFNGIVSIGDAGRNIIHMKKELGITGDVYIVHDKQSIMDIIERNSVKSVGKNVPINYNIDTKINIADNSADIVTCFMGLHHFPVENLADIVNSIHKILRSDGLFVIREHDAEHDLIPLLNVAHNIFNAVTGETLENEQYEIRQFRTVNEWIRIIENMGFEHVGVYDMQTNDPTKDFMLCFKKILSGKDKAVVSTTKFITENLSEYHRSLDQTYSTLTEWFLVDIAQKFGKFLETTPYYSFPYWRTIFLFWNLWYKEAKIIRQKSGICKAYFSEYTIGSIVQGGTVTMLFSLMSILSFVPRLIYTSDNNLAATKVGLMVIHDNDFNDDDFMDMDNRIEVLKKEKYDQTRILSLIRIPRYLDFTKIVIDLAHRGIDFHEICGQKEIQVKINVCKRNFDMINQFSNYSGCKVLFKYRILDQDLYDEVALSVKISSLSRFINFCADNFIAITHIYDY